MVTHIPGLATVATIPWEFAADEETGFVQYAWHADKHGDPNGWFVATVTFDGTGWAWRVDSLAPGHGQMLGAGAGPDRGYCQEMAVECVGKAYDSAAPHRGLATPASHRYTLADGSRVDLSALAGDSVVLRLRDGATRAGVLHLGGFYLSLASPDRTTHVPPSEVVEIVLATAAHS
ncbi:hypothetical protein CHO01_22680 [Cellulomonas hominis]|uniref:Uncharacterized protein n=1 Tax=Cellulomonas hominis TaxID=156981 RepID=A0A511FD69_9CELL|nr:hypothetical protein [Cellulomonas hominis]MBB5474598.1 hypothetical protein [Cellulomonas hominis]NKY05471.1 hypothetical protein [Cellulomonas hominis]GEL47152.1 hypothetical protein CHO01_22680 [Cellulomonas hominis]